MGRTYSDEEAGGARQSYDPASQLGMYRAPGGRRTIPTINTPSRGTDVHTDEPGMGHYGVPALPMAPRPPSVGLPATAGPADAGNRFGSTNAFQDSVNRSRALRQAKSAGYVDRLTQGQNEQAAARGAYAASENLGADLGLQGGGYGPNLTLSRGLAMDENARQNMTSGADAYRTGAHGNLLNQQAYVGIPAQAGVDKSFANINNTNADRTARMTPYDVRAADITNQANARLIPYPAQMAEQQVRGQEIANQGAAGAAPYAGPAAAAGVANQQAQATATAAGAAQFQQREKDYQRQIGQLQQRLAHFESMMSQQGQELSGPPSVPPPNAGLGTPAGAYAAPAATPAPQPKQQAPVAPQPKQQAPAAPQAKPLDAQTAQQFLTQAGGDKNKARELAKGAGYTF